MNDLHPDVVLAIQDRELMERREANLIRAEDEAIEADRWAAVAELADVVSQVCANAVADARTFDDRIAARELHERAAALERRLSS